jgi:integrase
MLTDVKARNAKGKDAAYEIIDGEGLHLRVATSGLRSWRVRRKRAGKETLTTLGHYPAMSLSDARAERDKLKAATGRDAPVVTLETVAGDWMKTQAPLWKAHHAADVAESLKREIWPTLGARPIAEITAGDILLALRPVELRGAIDLAHRLRQRLSGVWTFALVQGLVATNPAAMLGKALQPMVAGGRRAAVLTLAQARDALAQSETVPAHPVVRMALRVLALTSVRPGELRGAEWAEFDLGKGDTAGGTWTIPGVRMKHIKRRAATTPDHIVPLSKQAVEALVEVRKLTGHGKLVFPTPADALQPISENALGYLMNRAGLAGRQTAHGWRATFSTVMNGRNRSDSEVIERMLAHTPTDAVKAAYDRGMHAERGREIAQEWADLLLDGRDAPADLVKLPRRRSSTRSD